MDKKKKNDGLRTAAAGAAVGASAGTGAGMPVNPAPTPEPAKPEPVEPKPETQPAKPKPEQPEQPIDVIADPDNPIDINEIAVTISDIAVTAAPVTAMYASPMPPNPIYPIEPCEYGGPIAPWEIDPAEIECVYAGPITPDDEDYIGDIEDYDPTIP